MKTSYLISKIFRHPWALHPRIALNMGSFIANLVNGDLISADEKEPLCIYAVSPSGLKVFLSEIEENQESIYDNAPEGSVAFIPIKGEMLKEDTLSHYGTESIASVLIEAANHKNIKAAILETDSGGGSVDSIPPMIDAITYAKTIMPVLGWADMAASAAYWTISSTDLIVASNDISSEFGSIGVMMQFWDIVPYWEKEGFKFHRIYAPESSYKNKPFEMALEGDYDLIKEEWLSPLAKKFQKSIRSARNGKIDITTKGILKGRTFYANDAVKFGLADEIGNREYVIKRAVEMAK